jgi:hypothetical protein
MTSLGRMCVYNCGSGAQQDYDLEGGPGRYWIKKIAKVVSMGDAAGDGKNEWAENRRRVPYLGSLSTRAELEPFPGLPDASGGLPEAPGT